MTESEEKAKKLATDVTNFLNSMSDNPQKEFIAAMSNEHRTLQQAFTRLAFAWIENCASPEYRFDARNEATHKLSKQIIDDFNASLVCKGLVEFGHPVSDGFALSKHLPTI